MHPFALHEKETKVTAQEKTVNAYCLVAAYTESPAKTEVGTKEVRAPFPISIFSSL
jgi:hypothetical protein